jgi:hypothetical protein
MSPDAADLLPPLRDIPSHETAILSPPPELDFAEDAAEHTSVQLSGPWWRHGWRRRGFLSLPPLGCQQNYQTWKL